MKFESFVSLLNQFEGIEELHLQGLGEPMMHPQFFDMVRYAVERGIRVTTNSNLTLLSDRRAALCVSSGLHGLHVSVDSADPATYEQIRRGASFARMKRNLERIMQHRDALRSETPNVTVTAVVMRWNLDHLPNLVEFCAELRIGSLFVQHLCHDFQEAGLPQRYRPMRSFVDEQSLLGEDPQRVAAAFSMARLRADELGVELRLPRIQPREQKELAEGEVRCNWPWRGAYVTYQGYLLPCCMAATPDRVNFGNAFTTGLKTLWHGPDYREFRARLASGSPPDICRSCSLYRGVF